MGNTGLAKAHNKQNYTDEWFTPEYAIYPILNYIREHSNILCPFDTKSSNYVKLLQRHFHEVTYQHKDEGKDFFDLTKDDVKGFDYIISNPPYSMRNKILKHLYYLEKPFMMLIPLASMETPERAKMFREHGIEILAFDIRVSFIPSMETLERIKTETTEREHKKGNLNYIFKGVKGASMNTSYFCHNVLPEKLIFAEVNKHG